MKIRRHLGSSTRCRKADLARINLIRRNYACLCTQVSLHRERHFWPHANTCTVLFLCTLDMVRLMHSRKMRLLRGRKTVLIHS